eukprot:4911168-Prymnesium_polylepis.1
MYAGRHGRSAAAAGAVPRTARADFARVRCAECRAGLRCRVLRSSLVHVHARRAIFIPSSGSIGRRPEMARRPRPPPPR